MLGGRNDERGLLSINDVYVQCHADDHNLAYEVDHVIFYRLYPKPTAFPCTY